VKAIDISNEDAVKAYQSLESYNVIACELTRVWRVVYELKETGLVGGGPEYLIDKETGNIIDKKYYQ